MNAAFDQIAEYSAKTPTSRSTLRRDQSSHAARRFLISLGRRVREWGYASPLYPYRLKGRHPVQLLGSPDDPAPGNATLGSAIFGGDLLHNGEQVALGDDFWVRVEDASPAFYRYAHSFHWLQDLAQVSDQVKARDAAETILGWWLPLGEDWFAGAWRAETLARRMINWFTHAPLILSSSDLVYRSKVLTTMAKQCRHLSRVLNDTEEGLPRVYTAAALTLAGLLLPASTHFLSRGSRMLERVVQSFILPDGGPASRNTSDAIRTMQLLILVRDAYTARGEDLPGWVQTTLDRIGPFVRAMRHADGNFAGFCGTSAEGGHGSNAVLAASEAKGKPIENMAHCGFQRVAAGKSLLIMDAGTPPPTAFSAKAHAGTAGFEFSAGQERLIVNVGPASARGPVPALEMLARTTAAHSTLVIADRNSSRILENGKLGAGVSETLTIREKTGTGTLIRHSHNGYLKRFGVKHERTLMLSDDGLTLKGTDTLFGPKPRKLEGREVLLRFHLHPNVSALKASDGRITLETRSGRTWIFDADGGDAEIEDSLYLSRPDHPVPARQIVVRLAWEGTEPPSASWVLSEMSF